MPQESSFSTQSNLNNFTNLNVNTGYYFIFYPIKMLIYAYVQVYWIYLLSVIDNNNIIIIQLPNAWLFNYFLNLNYLNVLSGCLCMKL